MMGMWAREHQNTVRVLKLLSVAKTSTAHADIYFRDAASSTPFSERQKQILLTLLSACVCYDCDYVHLNH
jgi:hypothetical protein